MKRLLGLFVFFVCGLLCLQANEAAAQVDSCYAHIYQDTTGSPNGGYLLVAEGGGTAPLTYLWNTGDSTATIEVFDSLEYCVTIIDAAGCVAVACYEPIFFPDCWIDFSLEFTPIGATLTAITGGVAPISFSWSDGQTDPQINLLQAGVYCASMTDANDCSATACFTYTGNPNNDCSVYIIDTLGGWPGDSLILLAAIPSGTPPFTYLWNTGETTPDITVFAEGTYCVEMIDAVGCISSSCYSFGGGPDTCVASIGVLPAANGGADLCAYSTGPGPYTYQWSTGETSFIINVTEPGDYCVTVVDGWGCEASTCYTYDGTSGGPDSCSVFIFNDTLFDPTGAYRLLAFAEGVAPYTYEWSTGATTQSIYPNSSGVYCVTMTDAVGCVATSCYDYLIGGGPDSCYVYIYEDSIANPAGVFGLVAFANGVAPFTYAWNTGETTQSIVPNGPGVYCVTMTDAAGCVSTACYDYWIGGGPDTCEASIGALPSSNGGVDLCAYSTGPSPYTYLWSTGQTSFIINVTEPGDYCVTVTDGWGCEASTCYTYDGPGGGPDSCYVYIFEDSIVNPNGVIGLVAFANGVAPFTYEWSTGETTQVVLPTVDGVYCVTMTDAAGCVSASCYDYFPSGWPDSCHVYIYEDTISNPAGITTLVAETNGGVAPFTFEWSTGETTQSIVPSFEGVYCVTMWDAAGCVATSCYDYYTGNFPDSCSVFIYEDSIVNPAGITALVADANGGVAPYTFVWSTGETTQSIFPTVDGVYCVTMTDANGCVATSCYDYYTGGGPDSCIVFIYLDTLASGVAYLVADTPANGPVPFTFIWSTGDTTNSIEVTEPGIYCVTFIDGSGCTATACYDYTGSFSSTICGYVYPPDSMEIGSTTVGLYVMESGLPFLVDTRHFTGTANVWAYNFENLPDGDYIIRAEIDAGSLGANDYAPTYAYSTTFWDQAEVFTVPQTDNFCNSFVLLTPETGGNGSGEIHGNVYNMDGGLAGITILLLDEFGNIVAHITTDADGNYQFGNLPWGTYQVMIEWPGHNHAYYWVNLNGDDPVIVGRDFDVDENGYISTSTTSPAAVGTWKTYPNPATDVWMVELDESWENEVEIELVSLSGQTVASWTTDNGATQTLRLEIDQLPAGMYFYQLRDSRQHTSGKMVKQ